MTVCRRRDGANDNKIKINTTTGRKVCKGKIKVGGLPGVKWTLYL